jgi:hypothetical protein
MAARDAAAPRGDRELAVNRTQVCIGRTWTHDKLMRDLCSRQPLRHEAQDFDLAGGQAERVSRRGKAEPRFLNARGARWNLL